MSPKTKSDIQLLGILIVFIAILHFIFNVLNNRFNTTGATAILHVVQNVIYVILLVLAILSLSYKRLWQPSSLSKASGKIIFALCLLITVSVSYKLLAIYDQANAMYAYFKQPWIGLEGKIFQADDLMGYRPVPNSKGFHTYNISKSIEGKCPIFLDENGFRVPEKKAAFMQNDTTNLFLGCSFTWSDFNTAEESYPYLVSQQLGNNYNNAGVSGYGLCHMLLRAQELTQQKKYKYVFFQYSGWLINRATQKYGELVYGYRPFPYVVKGDSGNYIHPALFKASVYDVPREPFKKSPRSISDKLEFFYKIAYPVLLKDYLKKLYCDIAIFAGIYPEANTDRVDVVRYFYNEFSKICRRNGAQMVVVRLLNNTPEDEIMIKEIAKIPDVIIVDTDTVLNSLITNGDRFALTGKNLYTTTYGHTVIANGKDTIMYDAHYNYHASKIIANEVVKAIAR